MKKIKYDIYTDGACSNNGNYEDSYGGIGGWSYIVTNGTKELSSSSGGELETTNNRMELTAIIKALSFIKKEVEKSSKDCSVRIFSDSAYCVNAINKRWIKKWLINGWKTSKGTDVLNKDLWLKLNELDKQVDFQIIHIKGHNGNEFNEKCDKLAKNEVNQLKQDEE